MDEISLMAGIRNSLLDLKKTADNVNKTQQRLSTGKKINSPLDNATNYFAAQAHLNLAGDLDSYKDGIKEAIQVVKAADIGMSAITSVFRQAIAIAENAKYSANVNDLAQHARQFNEMRNQVDLLSADSGYRGTDLLRRQDLIVDFGNSRSLTIQGEDITSSGFDDMTNGLNVEAASMDPLNIVTPNFVLTSTGAIKEDGELMITNDNVPEIDAWLGSAGIKKQVITSQDVTLSTNTSFSDSRVVQSHILDNIGVAEYGNGAFDIYRDTTASAVVSGNAATVTTSLLQVTDVSRFLGPLLSDGSKPFTLERSLAASTGVMSGAVSVAATTLVNPPDVFTHLGPLAGSGSSTVELYRDMSASAAVIGDPAAVAGAAITDYSGVADLLGPLTGSGSRSFQLTRDITSDAAVVGDPAAVTATSVLDNSAVADFLGTLSGAGSRSFSLTRQLSLSQAENSAAGSVGSLVMNSSTDVASFIGSQADSASKAFTLTYHSASQSWSSSEVSAVTGTGGPPPTALGIDLVGNGTSITAAIGGTWSDGESITITTLAGSWESDNPAVGVVASGSNLNLDLNGNGSADITISLAGSLKADAIIGVDAAVSGWKSDNPSVTVAASGTSLDLDLNQNGAADMKISLARALRADAVVAVNTAASGWRTTDPSAIVAAAGSTLALDLNGNGVTDLTVQLAALSKPDARLATTSYLSSWFSAAHPEISVQPTGTSLGVNLGFDGAADLGLQLSSLLKGDAKIAVTTASSVWKTTDPGVDLNQPTVTGIMTADLNGDGNNDMQIDLPETGPYGAAWLSIEKVQVATTGPFRTTDPSVSLRYNDQAKTLGLQLDGSSEASDITIDLSATWAVNHLSVSPLGNGDAIDLTVDGRHRWVKGDGSTPNAPGIELSMSEMQEAINVIRLNSEENSSDLSVLTVRNQFIDEMAAILKTGAENLTLTDLNEEGSNLLLLQTRQNLGTTSLSITSKAAQNVLKLF